MFFLLFQFVLVRTLTIQAVSLAALVMMFVSLVFIPNPWCSMWVAFSIISIEVGVVGFMTMWDVNLDSISMINLIMCIGFSVDFSAHISYAYLTAKGETPKEKVRECLFSLGFPIVQGGLSTILGVVALTFAPSYIFVTFFKIVFLVIFFGIMHGIFLLPVLLSLMGPGSFSSKKSVPNFKYDSNMFIQKGNLQALPKSERHIEMQSPSDVILQSETFMKAKSPRANRFSEAHQEKDMGIGTSGEDSSEGSLQEADEVGPSVIEVRRSHPQAPLPIKEVYSNRAFVSDGEQSSPETTHRSHKHRLARRNSNYTPSFTHKPSSSLHRQYSEHMKPNARRKKKHHSRER